MFHSGLKVSATRGLQRTTVRSITIPFLPTLPQAPGGVKGDVNEAYVPPQPKRTKGSIHWNAERIVAVSLLPCIASAVAEGSIQSIGDVALGGLLVAHCFMGFQSCIIDYIPARVYGKFHNYAMYLLSFGSVLSAVGLYKLETEGDGVFGLAKTMWTAGRVHVATEEDAKKRE